MSPRKRPTARFAGAWPRTGSGILCCLALAIATGAQNPEKSEVAKQYEALATAKNEAGLIELWRKHPTEVLGTIDADLEESLALREKAGIDSTPSAEVAAQVRALHQRALVGARAADAAFAKRIFTDYASAFVSWNSSDAKNFREGQRRHGVARKLLGEKQYDAALSEAEGCSMLAHALGDWWGTAMGAAALAAAFEGKGDKVQALAHYGLARLLYHDLQLVRNEVSCVKAMVPLLLELGHVPRARAAADAALELIDAKDVRGRTKLLEQRLAAEERLNDSEAAARTRAALEALAQEKKP
ncbi:MAG: hypothetical protein ACKVX7_20270 [Planctomycetota bacterium]